MKVEEKPTGQYRRRIWYLYELLTDRRLAIPDLKRGNYVPLADDQVYVCSPTPIRSPRHRINVNLFGNQGFFPLVRRTARLQELQKRRLDEEARKTVHRYPNGLLARAVSYLYTKETKSSFTIEHEEPDTKRTVRFVELLRSAEKKNFLTRPPLIELQNATVDPRFAANGYRSIQNYVGETRAFGEEHIHYVSPKPEDVSSLMEALLATYEQMAATAIDPVLCAAVISFGFVFMHPFEDGNGRIHRFLIHNILARANYTPDGLIFPVSASMLEQARKYDEALESFSEPLLPLLDWRLNDDGEMTVRGRTDRHYRYVDFTFICEALYEFVADTVDRQLPEELDFLARYDAARRAARNVVDMPDRLIDLFVKVCAMNRGKLSNTKRQSHFAMLTDDEVAKIEVAISGALDGFEHKIDRADEVS